MASVTKVYEHVISSAIKLSISLQKLYVDIYIYENTYLKYFVVLQANTLCFSGPLAMLLIEK